MSKPCTKGTKIVFLCIKVCIRSVFLYYLKIPLVQLLCKYFDDDFRSFSLSAFLCNTIFQSFNFSRRALRFHYFLSVSEAFHYFGITITRELSWLFSIWGRDYSELSLLVTTHQKFYDDVLTLSFRAAKHI